MEQTSPRRIAVLITVHNRRETTLRCLRSLAGLSLDRSRFSLSCFMTDDGCTDGTPDAVRAGFPFVRILQGDGTLFWNRGMHLAWTEASREDFDYYLWINDDTFVYPEALNTLLDSASGHADQAIIVGSAGASDGSGRITYGGWAQHQLVQDPLEERPCETFNGNIVLIPRAVFQVLGANDPYYRHALGDFDYGLRARENGIGAFVAPGILGICDQHEHLTRWMDPSYPLRERWAQFFSPSGNNPFEFFHFRKRHFGWLAATGTFLSNFLHLLFPSLWLKHNKTHTP